MCATEKAGWLAACVLSLLCWALLPVDVNGVTQSTQNVSSSALHDHYRCMYCHKAEHIIDCLDVITCAPHEVCYIEKEVLASGWPVINAGCRSRHTCNLKTCFGESMHGYAHAVNKRSTLSCHHCCEGEFCNLYGCPDSEDMSVLPSTRCMACDAVKDPVLCDKLINCPYSQQCVSYGVFHAGGLRFELGCEETSYCGAFKNNSNVKRDVTHHVGEIDLASTCCDTHLCNRNWPPQDQPPPKVISGFTCHHQTERPLLSTIIGLSSTPPTVTSGGPSRSPTTHGPITSAPNITIPTSENCKDRATESNCKLLNITSQLCDTISLTSVYYCVKFCGFCSPFPTAAHMISTIPTIPVSGSRPTPSTPVSHATQATPVSSRTSSAPTTQKSTLEPSHSPSTAGPATSSPSPSPSVAHMISTIPTIPVSGSRPTPSTPVSHATQATPVSSRTSSAPTTQKSTLEPSHSPSTAGPATSSPNITLPSAENCTDRGVESACDYLNKTSQLCDTITITSVYYCVKFCGFCTPLPTLSVRQSQTTTTAGTVTTPVSQATVSTRLPQNVPVLVGKRLDDDSVADTDQRGRHPIS
ncbi:mucin-2-like isoform X2 [Mizuhopecten yessoensis]|uniref:mucin-2-like isoform X2 n=1 Tax=Mizuhopecten yessoensis TaxID=6573 RepID=UPI000B45F39F|nr:mucin-2-like isoform X2 [Mizuhopecten yessoensis]